MNKTTPHPSSLCKHICNPAHPLIGGIGVLTIAIMLALTACEEKKKPSSEAAGTPAAAESGSGVKLLASIGTVKFDYDDKNRIVKIHGGFMGCDGTTTLHYSGNKLEKSTCSTDEGNKRYFNEYEKESGNEIEITYYGVTDLNYTLNKDGYIMKAGYEQGYSNYYYQNGNVVKIISHGEESEDESEYKYDNKKSPFLNCKTPKWFLQDSYIHYAHANNVTESVGREEKITYAYEYDSDGFPTKRTSDGETTTFTYIGK